MRIHVVYAHLTPDQQHPGYAVCAFEKYKDAKELLDYIESSTNVGKFNLMWHSGILLVPAHDHVDIYPMQLVRAQS